MTIETLDPVGLAPIPGAAHVTIATGSRIVHISGQTGVNEGGAIAGPTHAEQATREACRSGSNPSTSHATFTSHS